MNTTEIDKLLERLGKTLSSGDLQGVSGCFAVPALLLSDEGATLLADANQIEKLFAQATEWYRSQRLISTRPDLEHVEELSEKVTSVDVRWPAFDASGREV